MPRVDGPRTDVTDVATITYYGTTDTSGCGGTGNCWHRGDRKTITNALGQSITFLRYDAAGRAVKVQDANSVVAELVFHPRGWLNQQIVRGPNDTVTTDDQITTFDHDARGNLTKVTSPDGSFAMLTWDGRDQLTRIDDQLQGWMVNKYDSAGNIESREWRQGTGGSTLKRSQALTVDALDRVVQAAGARPATLHRWSTMPRAGRRRRPSRSPAPAAWKARRSMTYATLAAPRGCPRYQSYAPINA